MRDELPAPDDPARHVVVSDSPIHLTGHTLDYAKGLFLSQIPVGELPGSALKILHALAGAANTFSPAGNPVAEIRRSMILPLIRIGRSIWCVQVRNLVRRGLLREERLFFSIRYELLIDWRARAPVDGARAPVDGARAPVDGADLIFTRARARAGAGASAASAAIAAAALLREVGFDEAAVESLSAHPHCTSEQVCIAIQRANDVAARGRLKSTRLAYIANAIREKYAPLPTAEQRAVARLPEHQQEELARRREADVAIRSRDRANAARIAALPPGELQALMDRVLAEIEPGPLRTVLAKRRDATAPLWQAELIRRLDGDAR